MDAGVDPTCRRCHLKDRAAGWRPITVGNLLAILFSGIVEKRLRDSTSLSVRQKGFVSGNGCFHNGSVLSKLYKLGRNSSLSLGILDVSKAFYSVPHSAFVEALMDQGVNRLLVMTVSNMYSNIRTRFKNFGEFVLDIKRVVK